MSHAARLRFAVALLGGWGCSPAPEAPGDPLDDALDETIDWAAEAQSDWLAFYSPDYVVPAFSDQTMCTFATYTGPDVGIPWAGFFQHEDYGHHVVLMSTTADEDDWPDGTVADCTRTDADIMVEARPFLFAGGEAGSVESLEMQLPDGMAIKLKEGQRFVIQSHHINYKDEPIRVNDVVFLETVGIAEVDTFAAPWVHTQTDLAIPPGASMSIEVDCAFDADVHLLSVLGHLHEWGASYSVDHDRADGTRARIYDIPEWDVSYRDAPPTTVFAPGAFPVQQGESFTSTCSWVNDTPDVLEFPVEMCATVGFAYPLTVPMICSAD